MEKYLGALVALAFATFGYGRAGAACTLSKIIDLDVTMEGEAPVVAAQINGRPVRFIADSGAFFSVISPASAQEMKLPLRAAPFGFFMMGVGGSADVSVATVQTFGLAGASIPRVEFLVGGSDVETRSVGVIGQNVLGLGDVEYDLAHGVIRLFKAQGCGDRALSYWVDKDGTYSRLDIQAREAPRQPFTRATVMLNGRPVRALFDTGASTSVLSVAAARRVGIRTDGPGVRFAGYSRGFGSRLVKTWIAPVDSLQIGGETVKHTAVRIGDVAGDEDDMLIGADFFLSHHVYVANSQQRMYFTYNGGPVFDLSRKEDAPEPLQDDGDGEDATAGIAPSIPAAEAPSSALAKDGSQTASAAAGDPSDAEGFSRRGSAFAARQDFARAIADYDRAVALALGEPRYLVQRAEARLQIHQPFMAMADLDAALKLKPDEPQARLLRAALRRRGHDHHGAHDDLDAAAAVLSKESDLRLQLAELYLSLDDYPAAIAQFDLWIGPHDVDARMGQALNGRCWARALAGSELDKALADCDRSVRLSRGDPQVLDSRGLVHLRRGEYEKAVADYNSALRVDPKLAWSLYGRGLAEEKTGQTQAGEADIAASAAVAPHLAQRAAKLGLTP